MVTVYVGFSSMVTFCMVFAVVIGDGVSGFTSSASFGNVDWPFFEEYLENWGTPDVW